MGLKEHIHIKEAARIYFKTLPFILLRFALILLFIALAIVFFSSVFGVVIGKIGFADPIKSVLSIAAVGGSTYFFFNLYKLFSRYIFYLVKAAHISMIVEYIEKRKIPRIQIVHGFKRLKGRFISTSILFVVDRFLEAVMKEVHKKLMNLASAYKVPKPLTYIMSGIVHNSVAYVDEAILAYMFTKGKEEAWQTAKDGIVLYVKNWKWIILAASILSFVIYGIMAVFGFYVYFEGIPFSEMTLIIQSIYTTLVAGVVVILFSGFVQPFIEISIIVTYLEEIRGQKPDNETFEWLKSNSKSFKNLIVKGGTKIA